jgi:hypothetical protein
MTISVKTLLQSNLLDFSAGIQNTTIGNLIASPGTFTTVTSNVMVSNSATVAGTVISTGSSNATGFIVGNGAVSNVALGYMPTAGTAAQMAIRDYSTVPSTMYFDNSNRTANVTGSFEFRSTSSFTQWAKIDQYGISLPTRPAFRISGNGASISATTTVSGGYMVVDYNQGSYLNTSTGLFTAPVAGLYQVNLIVRASANNVPSAQVIIRKTAAVGGAVTAQIMIEYAANTTMNHAGGSTVVKMAVGDTLKFDVTLGTISFDGNDNWSVAYIG